MQAREARGRITSHRFAYINNDQNKEGKMDVRKGPWSGEEDAKLIDCITLHGEGRWKSLACLAGLNRTGKSCRLRWLNYLRPNLRRGNLTIQDQLLILELHSRFGNRWSRIAQYLPGRTDNEIKNYWRTIVQKQARRLKCDANSHYFRYALRSLWLPRLLLEQSWDASPELFDHVQPNNCADHDTYWIDQDLAASQTELPPNYEGYDSQQLQGSCSLYTSDPSPWNDSWGNHGSNKYSLENFSLYPPEGLCSPFDRGAGFQELDDQAFVHMTEPVSPDIHLTGENFWLLPAEQTLESLISS